MNALFRAAAAAGCPVRRQTLATHILSDPAHRRRTRLSLTRTGYRLNLVDGLALARELHATQTAERRIGGTRRSPLHHRFYVLCSACGEPRHARRQRCTACGEGRIPAHL
jgi:hypothetical protein